MVGQELQNDSILTVTQLTGLIKTMLEQSFFNIQLKGEISNYRPNNSGHLYFTLKDAECQISAVMFRGRASTLDFIPKDGMLVQVTGSVSVYGPRGQYQFIINKMTKAGTGNILEMIEERKKKLAAEGLFDSRRKRPLPLFPQRIGVVTSGTGAALRDILNITKTRNPKMSVVVFPAIVQGEGAAESIIRMIKQANYYSLCDVLIVGRGGGSLEDLLPFSDEQVVRTIAASTIPTISAVGHDIDWALSDFAADVRASTPSHAAELCVPVLGDICQSLNQYKNDLYTTVEKQIDRYRLMLKTFTPDGMELQFRQIEQPLLNRFDDAKEKLVQNMQDLLDDKKQFLRESMQILENCNPQEVFKRGYSMVKDSSGNIIRSAANVKPGETIHIIPAEGTISAEVKETAL